MFIYEIKSKQGKESMKEGIVPKDFIFSNCGNDLLEYLEINSSIDG